MTATGPREVAPTPSAGLRGSAAPGLGTNRRPGPRRSLPVVETAVLVPVPAVTPVLAEHRTQMGTRDSLDRGIPDHITLVYPFLHPDQADLSSRARLARIFTETRVISFSLTSVRWWGALAWLAPEPAQPFIALTEKLVTEFGVLPYKGAYRAITPHLSISDGRSRDLEEAVRGIESSLPIKACADGAYLMTGVEGGSWTLVEEFRFASEA